MSIKEKREEKVGERVTDTYELILWNDDVNTFDYVIDVLIRVCEHDSIQAEQCALLTHYKGKCSIRSGSLEEMTALCLSLLEANLSAEVS